MSGQWASLCPSVVARGVCILHSDVTVKSHMSKMTKSNQHANLGCTKQSLSTSPPIKNQRQRLFHRFSLSLQISRSWKHSRSISLIRDNVKAHPNKHEKGIKSSHFQPETHRKWSANRALLILVII